MISGKDGSQNGSEQTLSVDQLAAATAVSPARSLRTAGRIENMLKLSGDDISSGRYRTMLYRFLTDNVPIVNACVWTWARLSAAPGRFCVVPGTNETESRRAQERLDSTLERLTPHSHQPSGDSTGFLIDLFTGLYRDGMFGGFLTVKRDGTGIDRFLPVDTARIGTETSSGQRQLVYDLDDRTYRLDRPDYYHLSLGGTTDGWPGRSILKAIPTVAYIEQQLVDDMRRASHNAGFHRLHVKITPPERMAGESDTAFTDRINRYFDNTVSMIRSCDVDDNPVTWDNVAIEFVGPAGGRAVNNGWFQNHRSMVEEICAGTNLAPFLLGYSYGATTTWSGFKFDMVMRQVRTVQIQVARFMEWIGKIDLALAGIDAPVRFEFNNTFAYKATDEAAVSTSRVNNVIKLYEAGLLDKETATTKAGEAL